MLAPLSMPLLPHWRGLTGHRPVQVMKAGITASQRRRRGDNALTVAVDPSTRRLLRLEEARSRLLLRPCTPGQVRHC